MKQIFALLVVLLAFGLFLAVGVVIAWAISQGHFIYGGVALAFFILVSIGWIEDLERHRPPMFYSP